MNNSDITSLALSPSTAGLPTFGLSINHKRPRPYLRVAAGGQLCQVLTHGWKSRLKSTSTRGAVTRFSPRSRNRCFQMFASIDRRQVDGAPLFMTLTYPADWPATASEAKAHLVALWKRLKRKYSWVSGIWRIELQKRGAPHFHILIFGISFLDYSWVAQNWAAVVGSPDSDHVNAGTEVRASISWNLAALYIAKYIAKVAEDEDDTPIGRHWGILGRANFPNNVIYYLITEPLFYELRAKLISLVTRGEPEKWIGGPYSGVWYSLPGYRPPDHAAWKLDGCAVDAAE